MEEGGKVEASREGEVCVKVAGPARPCERKEGHVFDVNYKTVPPFVAPPSPSSSPKVVAESAPSHCWQPARSRSILNLMNLWPVRSGPPPGKNLISSRFRALR